MQRVVLLALLLVIAGCASGTSTPTESPPATSTTAPSTPTAVIPTGTHEGGTQTGPGTPTRSAEQKTDAEADGGPESPTIHVINETASDWRDAESNGTRLTTAGNLTLEYQVVLADDFSWSSPSASPFLWFVKGGQNGTLRTNPSAGYVVLAPKPNEADDSVVLQSNYQVPFDDHPRWELAFVVRSTTETTRNVQELLLVNSPLSQNYFVFFDMGGASANPENADDACGADEATPYNRDQLSYRHRPEDRQCWDGFADRPIDWSEPRRAELRVDLGAGRIEVFLDGSKQADLLAAANQSMPPATPYHVLIKNRYRGDDSALVLYDLQVRKIGTYQSSGAISGVVDAGQPVNWTGVEADGAFPTGTSYTVRYAHKTNGTWTWESTLQEIDAERYLKYRLVLRTRDATESPELEQIRVTYRTA